MTGDFKERLHKPVTIHFKENSIPGIRRGVLTEESKEQLIGLFIELVGEDENVWHDNPYGEGLNVDGYDGKVRNELRAELINKLRGKHE